MKEVGDVRLRGVGWGLGVSFGIKRRRRIEMSTQGRVRTSTIDRPGELIINVDSVGRSKGGSSRG